MLFSVDGNDVFAATGGRVFDPNKPVIVFVHGAGCDRTGWMQTARAFAQKGWSVLAPDLPGHGRSAGEALTSIDAMVAWFVRCLDVAGVKRAAIVGHSMGGAIALETAARHPERVTQLGLVGTAAVIGVGKPLLDAAENDPARAYDMMTMWALAPKARLTGGPVPGLSLGGNTRAVFGQNRTGVLARDLGACNVWQTGPASAAKVACPTIVVAARLDVMTPAKRGEELARLIPGATLTMLADTGHMIPTEAPDALTRALQAAFGTLKNQAA